MPHQPATNRGRGLDLTREFQKIQNKCLRVVTGGFRATPTQSLGTLAHISLLDLYLTSRVVTYRKRAKDNGTDSLIEKACSRIKSTLGKPQACTTTAAIGHPEPAREGWIEDWMNPGRERTPPEQDKRGIGRALRVMWKERWEAAQRSRAEAIPQPPCGKVLTLPKST
jgi:hypothetical protein